MSTHTPRTIYTYQEERRQGPPAGGKVRALPSVASSMSEGPGTCHLNVCPPAPRVPVCMFVHKNEKGKTREKGENS